MARGARRKGPDTATAAPVGVEHKRRNGVLRVGLFATGMLACFLVGVAAGVIGTPLVTDVAANDTIRALAEQGGRFERHQGRLGLVNPLLECDLGSVVIGQEMPSMRADLDSVIADIKNRGDASTLSVYFRDLDNGPWFGVDEHETFIPASLMKVPLMLAYFRWSQANPAILDTPVTCTQADYNQRIRPRELLEAGRAYPARTLIEHMITESDNNAALALSGNEADEWMARVFRELGLPRPKIDYPAGEYQISVRQYAAFFRVLFNASFLDKSHSNQALELLARSSFREGLVAGVPSNLTVAHKFGERSVDGVWQFHDCGIVYYPDHPYLLCVMTRGADLDRLVGAVAKVSLAIYEAVAARSRLLKER